jgi:glycosyltransferase involved in cell wall biosynthesis
MNKKQVISRQCSVDISFITPVFNEAELLAKQIASIRRHTPAGLSKELIIVDNYSTDESLTVASDNHADLILQSHGTVAALRNEGANHAKGKLLVFLDADVFLTEEWESSISAVLAELQKAPHTVTGSWVSTPAPGTWIENSWFARMQQTVHSHINSGHMLILRRSFQELGGFDENLLTGEDYEFSVRAVNAGYVLFDDNRLKVIHHGYPRTLWEFFKREVWHGEGDYHNLASFLKSPIAMASQLALWVIVIGAVLALFLENYLWALIGLIPLSMIAVGAAITRWRPSSPADLPAIILLSYVYFVARAFSLYKAIWRKLAH